MKWLRSEKKGPIIVQITLKKRKSRKSSPKAEADAGSRKFKEEDTMDESKQTACSTLSKEKKTKVSKAVKEMALLCSIYDVNFRYFAKEHDLESERI